MFGVVIVHWNTPELLAQCLESLGPDVRAGRAHIWVVDNASDAPPLAGLSGKFPWVHWIFAGQNLGFSGASNLALGQIPDTLPFTLLLNPDTLVAAGCLAGLAAFLDSHPEAGAAGPVIVDSAGQFDPRCARRFPSLAGELIERAGWLGPLSPLAVPWQRYLAGWIYGQVRPGQPVAVEALSGAALAMRTSARRRVGNLDPGFFMYAEDTEWCYRLWRGGWPVYFAPAAPAAGTNPPEIIHLGGRSTAQAGLPVGLAGMDSLARFFALSHGRCYARAYIGMLAILALVKALFFLATANGTKTRVQLAVLRWAWQRWPAPERVAGRKI